MRRPQLANRFPAIPDHHRGKPIKPARSKSAKPASLKKFYTFMHEQGLIDADDLQNIKDTIKEEMSDWLATLDCYYDPDITDPMQTWGF